MESFDRFDSRRVRRTKNLLKRSFVELLDQKPYEKITIKDIVDYADFNRSTFYNYYKYKDEMVNEILDETLLELSETISFTRKSSLDLQVKDITIFDYILKKKRLFKLWRNSEAIPDFKRKFVETLIHTIRKKGHPLFHYNNGQQNDMLIIIWAHGTLGLITYWIKEDFATEPKVLAKDYLRLLDNFYDSSQGR